VRDVERSRPVIVVEWVDVANLKVGDIVASLQPRRWPEHSRALANLAHKLEDGQRPGVVVEYHRDSVGDVGVRVQCGAANLTRGWRAGTEIAIVSTSETPLDTVAELRDASTSTSIIGA
jgi:hypothetical protein